jgi:hypothetical protein
MVVLLVPQIIGIMYFDSRGENRKKKEENMRK